MLLQTARPLLGTLLFLGLVGSFGPAVGVMAEAPEMTRLFPAAGRAGQTLEIKLTGKFPVWPPHIHSASSAIRWEASAEEGILRAIIAEDAQSERVWVRLSDDAGASAAKAFVILGHDSLERHWADFLEAEPNNTLAEAQTLDSVPCSVQGVLEKAKEVDTYQVDLAAGETLFAVIDANRSLRSPVDATLQILDQDGFVLAQNLDYFGLDPSLSFSPAKAGRYAIRVFGFPATPDSTVAIGGKETWVYRLRLSQDPSMLVPFADTEDAVGDRCPVLDLSASMAKPVLLPACYRSQLSQAKERHALEFVSDRQAVWRFRIEGRAFGSAIDPVLSVEDHRGKELARIDDVADDRDPLLEWKCTAEGRYRLIVRDLHDGGGASYFYRATAALLEPHFAASVSQDLWKGEVGKAVEIPVSIQRVLDFEEELMVDILGLPATLESTPVLSQAKGDSAKKVTLRIQATAPFQGPVQIVARKAESDELPQLAKAPDDIPLWLSIIEPTPSKK
jgi:hypothetical protein